MAETHFSQLLIATFNAGKVREFASLLVTLSLRLHSLDEFPAIREVAETGATFAENAILKAEGYARQTQLWTLADDSGLEVQALDGAPGVLSARYAGPQATDAERIALLLDELAKTNDEQRRARFICNIAVADPDGQVLKLVEGICEGHLARAPRGTNGFGYDPVFIPEGYQQTFGELPVEVKKSVSHRARALAAASTFLQGLVESRA
ncbi:MAG TPA: XTP/dITP diphosphatase [Pyrinomonadaceae bacterium]|jgi:XTP/dITP diphosphohydrolase